MMMTALTSSSDRWQASHQRCSIKIPELHTSANLLDIFQIRGRKTASFRYAYAALGEASAESGRMGD